jgi:predicted amidohydrolase
LEQNHFVAGNQRVIIPYRGWNLLLVICYDLRFPVWIRNQKNEYDVLICTANWPAAREKVWQTLLVARALENLCYVCGVNRVGKDGNGIDHQGDSVLIDFKGNPILEVTSNDESIVTGICRKDLLEDFRKRFPVWMDADEFEITMA